MSQTRTYVYGTPEYLFQRIYGSVNVNININTNGISKKIRKNNVNEKTCCGHTVYKKRCLQQHYLYKDFEGNYYCRWHLMQGDFKH